MSNWIVPKSHKINCYKVLLINSKDIYHRVGISLNNKIDSEDWFYSKLQGEKGHKRV